MNTRGQLLAPLPPSCLCAGARRLPDTPPHFMFCGSRRAKSARARSPLPYVATHADNSGLILPPCKPITPRRGAPAAALPAKRVDVRLAARRSKARQTRALVALQAQHSTAHASMLTPTSLQPNTLCALPCALI